MQLVSFHDRPQKAMPGSFGDGIVPYKRVRTDGTVSLCGLFFTGNAAKEGGINGAVKKQVAESTGAAKAQGGWPAHCGDDVIETVRSLTKTAVKQCEKMDGMELITSSLNQLLTEYNGAVEQARHYYTLCSAESAEVKRYQNEAALVPTMMRKLFNQADAEKSELRKRMKELEEALEQRECEALPPTPSPTNKKVHTAQGSLRGTGITEAAEPESPTRPSNAPCRPQSPPGSPPLPSRQRPHSTIGWIRGSRQTPVTLPKRPYSSMDARYAHSSIPADYNLAPQKPYTARITRAFTSSADIRRVFDELDTTRSGCLSHDVVRSFYKSIDDFGVPKSEAQITDLLYRCSIRGAHDTKMTFPEFELLCLGVTRR
eukprot:TRINITY_DN7212_c0_g2_i1.p1 TRINITY_DN7212_c0_g2~~TRINITY_DN7212_c0_g2_i1.p1  ORF type:complete len:372 (+),score=83.08 TRINITY_DN7212_c0_g2_i1:128-1243(+)